MDGGGGGSDPGVRLREPGPGVGEGTAGRTRVECGWRRGVSSEVRSGQSRGRKGQSETHSCMVVGEETTAVCEAQPRNSSGSLTS